MLPLARSLYVMNLPMVKAGRCVSFFALCTLATFFSCQASLGGAVEDTEDSNGQENDTTGQQDTGDDTDPITSVVESPNCNSYAWCTTYSSVSAKPDLPNPEGGIIRDGLYRLTDGGAAPHALAVAGNSFTRIFRSDFNLAGTFETEGNTLTLNVQRDCNKNGTNEYANSFDSPYFYHVAGADLYLAKDCSVDFRSCDQIWKFTAVQDLCDNTNDLQCENASCECRFLTEEGMPGEDSADLCDIF